MSADTQSGALTRPGAAVVLAVAIALGFADRGAAAARMTRHEVTHRYAVPAARRCAGRSAHSRARYPPQRDRRSANGAGPRASWKHAEGDYAARKGVEIGCLTVHPSGLPHGPQPGAVEKALGATRTDELAVMWDTFRPLRLPTLWRDVDDPSYAYSWNPDRAAAGGAAPAGGPNRDAPPGRDGYRAVGVSGAAGPRRRGEGRLFGGRL